MKTHAQTKQAKHSSIEAKAKNQAHEGSILQSYKNGTSQLAEEEEPVQRQENKTGLPDNLKSGVENLSGHSLDDVKVHYNSSQPASLQAHAYAQGTDIHVASGQEKHLPHEAWHVVQQKQGRVQPTKQLKGTTNINDDQGLEKEADVMGAKAMQLKSVKSVKASQKPNNTIMQMQSKVTNTGQNLLWGKNQKYSTIVGKKMEAYLDPDDKLQGESANINSDQNEMMWWLKSHHDIKATDAVKGHLLNDNVGGKALNVNLFPITKAANAVHLRTAENFVKNKVWDDQQGVYYKVEASIGDTSTFEYKIQNWNPTTLKKSGSVEEGTIYSDLGSPKDMDVANEDELDYEKAQLTNANAVKKGRAFKPVNKVGDLDNDWSGLRDKSGRITDLNYTSDSWDIKYNKK
jgi:hypothetical protein